MKINYSKTAKVIRFFVATNILLIFSAETISAQNLLTPKNNMEYMSIPTQVLSDFDTSNVFEIGDRSFLIDGKQEVTAVTTIEPGGINGSNCLKIHPTNFPVNWGGTFYLEYTGADVFLNTADEGVGLWLKSNNDTSASFYFEDANGVVFYVAKKLIEGMADWSYSYAVPESIKRTNTNPSSENPAISYPCKFLGLSFYVKEEHTDIYVDEVSKITEINQEDSNIEATFFVSSEKLANIYNVGESVTFIATPNASIANSKLKLILKNYKGDVLSETDGDGSLNLTLPTDAKGYFEVFVLSYEGSIAPENLVAGEVFQYGVIDDSEISNDRLSVAIHPLRWYYDIQSIDLTKIIGASYIRFDVVMDFIENSDGTFKFKNHTVNILNRAKNNDLKFLCVLRDRKPPLDASSVEKFLNFSRYVLNTYNDEIKKVELWNEWSNKTGTLSQYRAQQTPENYAVFLESMYPTLKQEYPDIEFIGIGGENPKRFNTQIQQMFDAGIADNMDAFSLHPYRQPYTPDSRSSYVDNRNMADDITNIIDMSIDKSGPEKVYVTEIGYPSHNLDTGVSEFMQAQHLIRTFGILLSTNNVENITWYNLYNIYEDGLSSKYFGRTNDYAELQFGLFDGIDNNFSVKNSAMAFRFFADITDGFGSGEHIEDGLGFHKLTLSGAVSGKLEIVWDNKNTKVYTVPNHAIVYDMMGNALANSGTITVGREPIYVLLSELLSTNQFHNEIETNKRYKIFPNPTNSTFAIKSIHSEIGNFKIKIYSMEGKLMDERNIGHNELIDIENYTPGMYLIKVYEQENASIFRIIKN